MADQTKNILFSGFGQPILRKIFARFVDNAKLNIFQLGKFKKSQSIDSPVFEVIRYTKLSFLDDVFFFNEILIDVETLESYSSSFETFIRMTDRLSAFPVHASSRIEYFTKALNFCLLTVNLCRPDLVLFGTTPHLAVDWLLSQVCEKNNIPYYAIERTHLGDFCVLVGDTKFGMVPIKSNKTVSFEEFMETVGENSAGLVRSKIGNKKVSETNFIALKLMPFLSNFNFLRLFKRKKIPKFKTEMSMMSVEQMAKYQYLRNRLIVNHSNLLKKAYNSKSVQPDLTRKFIYFPLHLQPEKTTVPLGGWFADQLLAVKTLSKGLPHDVWIYVKEHPRQFTIETGKFMVGRSPSLYSYLTLIDNVEIIDQRFSSEVLIENSIAVSTITGSAGWEAILKSKPAIIFGNIWYKSHPSCYLVKNSTQVAEVFSKISTLPPLSESMRVFYESIQNNLFLGSNFWKNAVLSKYGPKKLEDSTFEVLDQMIRSL